MNWLGRTKIPRRTRPAPPSSERLNDPQSSTSGMGAVAGTADNLRHASDDGDGQRDPYSVYGDPDSPVNTTLEKIEKTEKNDKQDKADDCTSARSTGEDSVDSCATNGDNVPQRVHFTDNPRRYMTNLSKSGWYYRYHSQYVSKNAKDRRVSAYYKCALARRKGFGTCPARVLISRTAGAAKFRVDRLGLHVGHGPHSGVETLDSYDKVLDSLEGRIEMYMETLADARTGSRNKVQGARTQSLSYTTSTTATQHGTEESTMDASSCGSALSLSVTSGLASNQPGTGSGNPVSASHSEHVGADSEQRVGSVAVDREGGQGTEERRGCQDLNTAVGDGTESNARLGTDEVARIMLTHLETYICQQHVPSHPFAFRRDLQAMIEPYGFPMRVERSKYHDKGVCKSLKYLQLRCTARVNGKRCPFHVVVHGTLEEKCKDSGSDGCNGDGNPRDHDRFITATMTVHCGEHSHDASATDPERRYLPSRFFEELLRMVLDDNIPLVHAIRMFDRKYKHPMNIPAIRRRIVHRCDHKYPVQGYCHRLEDNLERLQRTGMVYYDILRRYPGRELAVYWFTCPAWLQHYYRYGVVAGVCTDAKVVANNYNLPFVTICGRDHNGHVRIYAAAFLPDLTQESHEWFIRNFLRYAQMPPKTVGMDQDFASYNAWAEQSPTTLPMFDPWHLNKNQEANVARYLNARGRGEEIRAMIDGLYSLRRCYNARLYKTRRKEFEVKFLAVCGEGRNVSEEEECEDVDDDDDPSSTEAGNKRMEKNCDDVYVVRAEEDGVDIDRPQWYVRNFYHYCDAIVDCFNLRKAGMLFGLRGSTMCESGNADFRRIVMVPKLAFSEIPERLITETMKRSARQEAKDRVHKRSAEKGLQFTRLFATDNERHAFVSTLTNYALGKFMDLSLRRAGIWRLKEHSTILEGDNYNVYAHGFCPPFIRFRLRRDEERDVQELAASTHERRCEGEYDVDIACNNGEIKVACQCHFSAFWGFPCQHVVRLCELFRERSDGQFDIRSLLMTDTVPLLSLFSIYWHKDHTEWLQAIPSEREKRDEQYGDHEDCAGDEEDCNVVGVVADEHTEMARTQELLNLANQSVRTALTLGPHTLIYVRNVFAQINATLMSNKIPLLRDTVMSPDELTRLQNPNSGPGGYRGGISRKRAWHESNRKSEKPAVSNKRKRIN